MGFLAPTTKSSVSVGETSEFAATSSEYGKAINRVFGSDRLDGNLIWWSEIRLTKSTSTQTSGGKGGAKQKTTTTTFEYFADLDVAFGEGEASDIVKLWFDGKLVYDRDNAAIISDLTYRFYPGSETQLPDPLVEAALGENNASANRGLVHIVFENLNLADYGNRIPAISAELAYAGLSDVTKTTTFIGPDISNTIYSGDGGGSYTTNPKNSLNAVFNDEQGKFIVASTGHDSGAEANIAITMSDLSIDGIPSRNVTDDIFGGSGNVSGIHEPTNDLLNNARPNVGGNRFDLWIRDDVTGNDVYFTNTTRLRNAVVLDANDVPITVGIEMANGDLSDIGYASVNMATNTELTTLAIPAASALLGVERGRAAAQLGSGIEAEAFGAFMKTTEMKIVQIVITTGPVVSMNVIATITPSDIVPGATSWNYNPAMAVDRSNGNIFFHSVINGVPYVWGFSTNLNAVAADPLLWATQVPFVKDGVNGVLDPGGSLIGTTGEVKGTISLSGGQWLWVEDSTSKICGVSLSSGNLLSGYEGTTSYAGIGQGKPVGDYTNFHWHDATSSLIGIVDDATASEVPGIYVTKFNFNLSPNLDPQAAIEQMCLDAGLEASEIDVTALPTSFAGVKSFKRTERGKTSASIQNLLDLIAYNVVEVDGKIKFKAKGAASSRTVPEDDLVRNSSTEGEVYVKASSRERDLPRVFEVDYSDSDNAYQNNVQRAQRPSNPVTSVNSDNIGSFSYSGAGSADAFQGAATRDLYSAWAEADKLTYRLPPRYLDVTATDTITLVTTQIEYEGRVRISDLGADFTTDIEQVIEVDGQYTVVGVGSGGAAFVRDIPNTGPSTAYLMNLPLLNDVDSRGASISVFYWAAAGEPIWPGAQLYEKTGTSVITEQGTSVAEVASGLTTTALPDPTTTTRFEDDSVSLTFDVTFGDDQFESTTVENILAGANALAVIKANGDIEVIQFKTAVFDDVDTVTISGFLRGRRGTEPYATGHAIGERVILLSTLTVSAVSNPVTDVGSPQEYVAPTIGQLFESAADISFTPTGEDLKPYSVVNVEVTNPGTPDGIDIGWVRRTRIGGEMTDGADVPLSEESESYEVDILDGPGGTVLRTLTSSAESVNYSAANITTDFGSLPATLDVVIYQMSAAVGRGKPAVVSLETT